MSRLLQTMEGIEEQALRMLKVQFIKRLDVGDYVLDFLEQEQALSDLKCEQIRDILKRSRLDAAQATIDAVLKKSVVLVFMKGLLCGNSHPYLARLLSDKIDEVKQTQLEEESYAASTTYYQHRSKNPSSSEKHTSSHLNRPYTQSQSLEQRKSTSEKDSYPQRNLFLENKVFTQRHFFNQSQYFPNQSFSENQLLLKSTSFSPESSLTSCITESPTISERRSQHYDPDETSVLRLGKHVFSDGGGECRGTKQGHNEDVYGWMEGVTERSSDEPRNTRVLDTASPPSDVDDDAEEEETRKTECVILKQPNKVDVMDKKKRTLTKIHYHLKLLSHDGQKEKFEVFVCKYKKRFRHDPDILFTLLDAEVESRRLVYDEGLNRGDIFNDMETCITSSSQPLANIVMFLARKGSARTMKESLEVGLDMLEEARALSEQIKPCKDTGMVLYILINILFQMYEKGPCLRLKERIIRTVDEAISDHFAESPPFLLEDYIRMLFLKMVFCYLGIGLFGNTIKGCDVSVNDVRAADECLKIIDQSKPKFDNRREMFYSMAKSVLCTKQGQHKEALDHAETAKRKAEVCGFKKELGPIQELAGVLERTVAEQNERDTEEREEEIEAELEELERQRELAKIILKKSSNQWGNPQGK